MARAPFQVLVYPYRGMARAGFEFALFRRADGGWWQGIAGGGEEGETPLDAARREAHEEARLPLDRPVIELDTVHSVPVTEFRDSYLWGEDVYVIPQYSFGIQSQGVEIVLSREHTEVRWMSYDQASRLLRYDGDRTALWELLQRLRGRGPWG